MILFDGKTYESTETVRFVHDSYPTGMTMTVPSAISRFQLGSRLDRSMEAARESV